MSSLQGIKGFDKESFEKMHTSGEQVTSIRFNPEEVDGQWSMVNGKTSTTHSPFNIHHSQSKFPGHPTVIILTNVHHLHWIHFSMQGLYYVQEASSMFLEEVIKANC